MLGETIRERHGKNWPGAGNLPSQKPPTVAEGKGGATSRLEQSQTWAKESGSFNSRYT